MNYLAMNRDELIAEQQNLLREYTAFKNMNLKLDMSRGKPSREQLDLSLDMLKITDYMDSSGADARNYGHLEGIPEARQFFSQILGVSPAETFVGGNSSLHLMYHMINLGWNFGFPGAKIPWKDCNKVKFICPVPGYDRHFRITETFGFELISVPMLPDGPDMDMVEELVRDPAVKGIWCVPVYSNPDGYIYSDNTVTRLAHMKAAAPDFKIFWDNAYGVHHLGDIRETCPNILQQCRKAGNECRPLLFFSTSKITFAGSGVAALGACLEIMKAITNYFFSNIISFDKVNQLRHVRFLKNEGGIAEHMQKHAEIIAPKFNVVIDTFNKGLAPFGNIARWTEPRGGYFLSLYTMKGCAARTVELCRQAGVTLTGAGAAFPYGKDPDDSHIRIAPPFRPQRSWVLRLTCLCGSPSGDGGKTLNSER